MAERQTDKWTEVKTLSLSFSGGNNNNNNKGSVYGGLCHYYSSLC